MQKNSTIQLEINLEQITSLFEGLQNQLSEIKQSFQPKEPAEYLSRTEVKEMLRCDLSTVHNYTVKGKLKAYGIGNRVYYKRSEIEAALIPLNNKG